MEKEGDMEKEVKVSVIIPVYNVEEYLRQCVDSVINQTLKEIEVICVDDGSDDSSLEILHEYEKKDERVKVLTQNNLFAGIARNNGMSVATGKYYVFLDSDDFFELDMLEKMYNQCENDSADVCICSADRYNTVTGEFTPAGWYLNTKLVPDTPFNRKTVGNDIFRLCSPSPWNKMFSSKLVKEHNLNFMGLQRTNDLYFVECALALAERITTTKEVFVHYRVAQTQNLQSKNYDTPFCFCDALWELKKKLYLENILTDVQVAFVKLAFSTAVFNIDSLKDHPEVQSKVIFAFKNLYSDLFGFTNKEMFKEFETWNIKKWEAWFGEDSKEVSVAPLYEAVQNPKVSIIIPVYNVEKYLTDCVYSAMKQTVSDIEIICVNDETPDNSEEIVLNLMKLDKRIRLVNKKNGGLSSARNAGMKVAQGKYVIFLDSDDYFEPDTIEVLFNRAEKDNLDVLDFNARAFFETDEDLNNNKGYLNYYDRQGDYSGIYSGMELFGLMQANKEVRPAAWLHMVSKKLYTSKKIYFYEGIIHEDNEFSYNLLKKAKRVGYVPNVFYNRRVHGDSIMTVPKSTKNVYGYFVTVAEIFKDMVNKNLSEKDCEALEPWVRNMVNIILKIYGKLEDKNMDSYFASDPEMKIMFDVLIDDADYRIRKELKAFKEIAAKNITSEQPKTSAVPSVLVDVSKYRARIDIKNIGASTNDIEILSKSFAEKFTEAKWMSNNTGKGYIVHTSNHVDEIQLKCIGAGQLKLSLKGPEVKNKDGKRVPIRILFKNLFVDGNNIFSDSKIVWHDDEYIFKLKVEDGQIVTINTEWLAEPEAASFLMEEKINWNSQIDTQLYQKNKQISDQEEEIKNLRKELLRKEQEIKSSKSWRVGRVITFVPRKVKRLIRKH